MTGFVDTSHASPDVSDRDMPTRGGVTYGCLLIKYIFAGVQSISSRHTASPGVFGRYSLSLANLNKIV